jgi:hypothetical protein
MEKFSLFDLLAFAIPGSLSLFLVYWGVLHTVPFRLSNDVFPETLLALVFVMLAYWAGHIVNELAMWLEKKLGGLPQSWVEVLTKNKDLAQRLNSISQSTFSINFLEDDGRIKPAESGMFYDYAFNALEMSGKLEKPRILQSQYTFLRNCVAICALGALTFGMVFIVQKYSGQQWNATVPLVCIWGLLASLILGWLSRRLSIKRRHFKMSATLHCFYAFYVIENKLKISK